MIKSPTLWWQTGVIYQVYPRSFQDSDGDGVGDLLGVITRLDYLEKILGVDAIWISPFYPSPMADFGYDVANYRDVDPLFGDLDTFDRLLSEAHQRGMKIIIDMVPNHTSDQHPWFLESRSSKGNNKRDWYVWRDAKADGTPPNNWLANFGGSSWEWDEQTGQYYLHSFLKEQPDLNWRNPSVRTAMLDVYRFWLDRGVDGFRIDVAHSIMKDPALRDNPVNRDRSKDEPRQTSEYNTQIHVNDKGHPDVHLVHKELRKILDSYTPPRFMIGEIHVFDWKKWASYYGEDNDELHMPFNFSLLYADWNAVVIRKIVELVETHTPPWGWPNYVLGNHDEKRIASKLGPEKTRQAAMLLLTLRGTPTIYNGDEFGQTNVVIAPELIQDPWGKQFPGAERDGCRTPNQWTDSPNAGFTEEHATPWLPISHDYQKKNMETELRDPKSLLNLYRKLLSIRKESPALHAGSLDFIDPVPQDCMAYVRSSEGEKVIAAFNFGKTTSRIDFGWRKNLEIIVSTGMDKIGIVESSKVDIAPSEGLVLRVLP